MDSLEPIKRKIYEIRGRRVMLDSDLADMYNVETKNLKRAVRANIERFPDDFMFELTKEEYDCLRCKFFTLNNEDDAISTALSELQKRDATPHSLPEIGYTATQQRRKGEAQNPPQLTNLNNPLTYRTKTIALHPRLHVSRWCRAFVCLFLMVFSTAIFSSCEKTEVLQISVLDWYYDESLDLYEADLDSVERFQQKVKDYVTRYPETVFIVFI